MLQALLRWLLGVLAGAIVTFLVIMGVEWVGHRIYPPPPGLDPTNTNDMATLIATAPIGALVAIVVAWVLGAFAGGAVAAWISRTWPRSAAIVVSLVVLIGVVGMILMMPGHPTWMAALGLILPVPSALLGAWLARPRRASSSP